MKNKPPILTFIVCCLLVASYTQIIWCTELQNEDKEFKNLSTSARPSPMEKNVPQGNLKEKSRKSVKRKHPQLILRDVRKKLIRYSSIRADIKQTVALGDRFFRAEGSYLQGTNLRLRLEFSVIINQKKQGSLLQVCEGDVLWTQVSIGEEQRVSRRVVRDILKSAAEKGELSKNMLVAQLGLGGLPALMSSIEQNMVFDAIKEETVDNTEFIILQGHWNEKFIKRWQEGNVDETNEADQAELNVTLPMRVPDIVRIYCNKTTLFPQRILYLKKHPEKKKYRQMVVLDFQNIQIDTPLDDREFQFVPPDGVIQEDDTKRYLELLRKSKRQRSRLEQGQAVNTPPK